MTGRIALCLLLLTATPALAQTTTSAPMTPASQAPMTAYSADQGFMAAMQKMNAKMQAPMTDNPDADFVAMMMPHHQGAIDMAKVELKYGKSATLRRMAHAIIKSQSQEIGQMQRWQSQHGTKSTQK